MWCNQIFSLLSLVQEATDTHPAVYVVVNTIVADNYEAASKIARAQLGDSAIAMDTTLYPVSAGCVYVGDNFYNEDGELIERNKTEEERITVLERENTQLEEQLSIMEENDAELLYQVCLLQLGVSEEDLL